MAGIGKTTLAVHVAHSVTAAYPDGQMYANLGGTDEIPQEPVEVLGRVLRALGVPSAAVSSHADERAELYRTVLAGRRVLIVLDNAATEQQIRPLLPGSPTCAVLLTSRSHLPGIEGARWAELDVLPGDEGVRLLECIVGPSRVSAHPQAAADVVRLCGGLPLSHSHRRGTPGVPTRMDTGDLVVMLPDGQRRLDRLEVGACGT